MRVGFAGLGRMGTPMATNLANAGHELLLWNRSSEKAAALAKKIGAQMVSTPAELASKSAIIVTMLSDDASSMEVYGGVDGLFSGSGADIFIEMGTMSPDHIYALIRLAPKGTTIIDAPVSGATQAAKEAQLLIMAGCTNFFRHQYNLCLTR